MVLSEPRPVFRNAAGTNPPLTHQQSAKPSGTIQYLESKEPGGNIAKAFVGWENLHYIRGKAPCHVSPRIREIGWEERLVGRADR